MAYFRLSPPRRTDIGNVLTQDLEDMHISTLAVYVQNFPVVCDKPEQLIWVKKTVAFGSLPPVARSPKKPAVINRAHGLGLVYP